jgi:hypothetical protein
MLRTALTLENYSGSAVDFIGNGWSVFIPGNSIGDDAVETSCPSATLEENLAKLIIDGPAVAVIPGEETDDGTMPDGCHKSSGVLDESGVVSAAEGVFYGALFVTDGTNDLVIEIYDNAEEAEGDLLVPALTVKGSAINFAIDTSPGIKVTKGIFVDVTCDDGTFQFQVYYG